MKTILLLFGFILVAIQFAAAAASQIPRIGYVSGTGDAFNQGPYVEALRHGLKELGYIEGKNSSSSIAARKESWTDFPAS